MVICEGLNHHVMKGEHLVRVGPGAHTLLWNTLSSLADSKDIWKDALMFIFQRCFEGTREEMQLNTNSDFFS